VTSCLETVTWIVVEFNNAWRMFILYLYDLFTNMLRDKTVAKYENTTQCETGQEIPCHRSVSVVYKWLRLKKLVLQQ